MTERRRRLIEVAFSLEEVSARAAREKNVKRPTTHADYRATVVDDNLLAKPTATGDTPPTAGYDLVQ